MVNIEKLSKYIAKAGTTWETIAQDCGGLPETLEIFAETFENDAKAEDVAVIADALQIPAHQIGLVFFAPEEYDQSERPQLAALKDFGDAVAEIFAGLSVKSRTKLLSLAYELQEAEAEEVAING